MKRNKNYPYTVRMERRANLWFPRFFDDTGDEHDVYVGFADYDKNELMDKILRFFPNAEYVEA